jgi:hypothetical protein
MSELGPIATRVLYEDDEVRIWDQQLQPGESTAVHHHAHDYALVDVDGDRVEVFPVAGAPNPHGIPPEGLVLPANPRGCVSVPGGSTEVARNSGTRRYRAILVEFKPARDAAG